MGFSKIGFLWVDEPFGELMDTSLRSLLDSACMRVKLLDLIILIIVSCQ